MKRPSHLYWFLLIPLFFINCSSESTEKTKEIDSVTVITKRIKPDLSDATCLKDISSARTDFNKGMIAFYKEEFGVPRYDKELVELCKKNNLTYKSNFEMNCTGHKFDCYKYFMDSVLDAKFGNNFKKNLQRKADDLFCSRITNEKINARFCDVPPHFEKVELRSDFDINIEINHKKYPIESDGRWNPFMDISFVIDTSGNTSDFGYSNCAFFAKNNEKYFESLFNLGADSISRIKSFSPGKIKGKKVNTRCNARVYFLWISKK